MIESSADLGLRRDLALLALPARAPGSLPGLDRIHLFNHGAQVSHGTLASDIPGTSVGAGRLADAISQAFFREDQADIRAALDRFDEPELAGTPFFVPRG